MEFKDGEPIKETNYSPYGDGTVTSSVDYEYYSNGNLKSKYEKGGYTYTQNLYYENGKLKSTITPTCTDEYNEAGKLVKTISSPADKDVTPSITYYEYDSDGRKILETEYEKDGKTLISKRKLNTRTIKNVPLFMINLEKKHSELKMRKCLTVLL